MHRFPSLTFLEVKQMFPSFAAQERQHFKIHFTAFQYCLNKDYKSNMIQIIQKYLVIATNLFTIIYQDTYYIQL